VARRYPLADIAFDRLAGEHLGKPRSRIVRLVDVEIRGPSVRLREIHRELDRVDAILASVFVVRNRTDDVRAHLERLPKQVLVSRIGEDPVLRERDDLEIDDVRDLLSEFKQGPDAGQRPPPSCRRGSGRG